MRPSNPPFQGEIGANAGFAVYDTMENGIRALAKNLLAYYARGIDTVAEAISRWAPSADHNNTLAYIAFVCSVLSCQPDDEFNFRDPDFLFWMVTAIGEQEQGHDAFTQNVSDQQIEAGVAAALA